MQRGPLAAFCLAVALALAVPATAQTPVGDQFEATTQSIALRSPGWNPRSVAMSPDGDFVVTWTSRVPGGDPGDIMARRFAPSGRPLSPELRVNTVTASAQGNDTVAMDDAGRFVVAWDSEGQGIAARMFDADGSAVGTEFVVHAGTAASIGEPWVAMAPDGAFVVAWTASDADDRGIFARRFAPSGTPMGAEFQVNAFETGFQQDASVGVDAAGNFVVVWTSAAVPGYPALFSSRVRLFDADGTPRGAEFAADATATAQATGRVARARDGTFVVAWWASVGADLNGIEARRFDAAGTPAGASFAVNTYTTDLQKNPSIAADGRGGFVVSWMSRGQDGSGYGVIARQYDAAGTPGPELVVNQFTVGSQAYPSVAQDPAGNFVVAWVDLPEVWARVYAGGVRGSGLAVDAAPQPTSNGNGVLEAGETVVVAPSWSNAGTVAAAFSGTAASFTGPGLPGDPQYSIVDGSAMYPPLPPGVSGSCATSADCYTLALSIPSARPAAHWDARFKEELSATNLSPGKSWVLHVGGSFGDVAPASPFARFVETILHHSITAGCAPASFCPAAPTTREQMGVFVLVTRDGFGHMPVACTPGAEMFDDVPAASPFCPWIEELARRGVTTGCGGSFDFCPAASVSREQMAVFALRAIDPVVVPPPCATPTLFADMPASSPFCRWIEELARRGVVAGCGGGNYCPSAPVSREQMAVFLSVTAGLTLYGP